MLDPATGEARVLSGLHEIHASPYLPHVLTCPLRNMASPIYAWAEAPRLESSTAVRLRTRAGVLADVVALGPQGEIFAVESTLPPTAHQRSLRVYRPDGEPVAEVPDCPRPSCVVSGSSDLFEVDARGDLYQMEVRAAWERPSRQDYVRIWKWARQDPAPTPDD
ncbi:MAG: hypothetical protein AB1505_31280 [Candidatus Latescibacterota bacterium]